ISVCLDLGSVPDDCVVIVILNGVRTPGGLDMVGALRPIAAGVRQLAKLSRHAVEKVLRGENRDQAEDHLASPYPRRTYFVASATRKDAGENSAAHCLETTEEISYYAYGRTIAIAKRGEGDSAECKPLDQSV